MNMQFAQDSQTLRLEGKVRWSYMINIVLISVLAFISISPYWMRNISNELHLLVFLLWIMSSIMCNSMRIRILYRQPFVVYTAIWYGIQVISRTLNISTIPWGNYFFRIIVYGIPFMLVFVRREYNRREKKVLLYCLLMICAYNIIDNILLWLKNPTIFSTLNYAEQGIAARKTNAGSTPFVHVTTYFGGACCLLHIFSKKRISKIVALVMVGLCGFYITVANPRTTAFLFYLAILFGAMLLGGKTRKNEKKALIIAIVLLLFFMLVNIVPTLQWFASILPSDQMSAKLNNIAGLFTRTYDLMDSSGSLAARYQLALTSIKTCFGRLDNFMIGVGESTHGYSVQELLQVGVGSHAELLDSFAEYGFLGGLILCMFFISGIKYAVSTSANDKRSIMLWMLGCFFLYGFFDNIIQAEIFYVIFLIYPLIGDVYCAVNS